MAEEHFDIRMEKMDDHTSTDKYAIIGYFSDKLRQHNEVVARMAAEIDPESANPAPSRVNGSPTIGTAPTTQQATPTISPAPSKVSYRLSNILADSRAEQWLLAFIAFLLFLNLICKE